MTNKEYFVKRDILASTLEAIRVAGSSRMMMRMQAGIGNDFIPPSLRRGASIDPSILITLAAPEIDDLIAELKMIQSRFGMAATFGGRQINLVLLAWNQLVRDMRMAEPLPDSD